jgi:hypothetical protein
MQRDTGSCSHALVGNILNSYTKITTLSTTFLSKYFVNNINESNTSNYLTRTESSLLS